MAQPRIYLDTSVIGGCCDGEFERWSRALLDNFRIGIFRAVLSDLTERELQLAPPDVHEVYDELLALQCEHVAESTDSLLLAQKYLDEGILTENYEDDARHIAVATVSEVDILVSWNFKHIVHYDKIARFNAVNALKGYRALQIFSPMEVAHEDV